METKCRYKSHQHYYCINNVGEIFLYTMVGCVWEANVRHILGCLTNIKHILCVKNNFLLRIRLRVSACI